MDESFANASYRALELLCRRQAKLANTPGTRGELEDMAREYKQLADREDLDGRIGPSEPTPMDAAPRAKSSPSEDTGT